MPNALLVAEHPHVLVADVRLGEFNGIQLLMLAREVRPGISAVITNAFVDSVLADETRRLGGTFMVKPLDSRDLLDAVRTRSRQWADANRRGVDRRLMIDARLPAGTAVWRSVEHQRRRSIHAPTIGGQHGSPEFFADRPRPDDDDERPKEVLAIGAAVARLAWVGPK